MRLRHLATAVVAVTTLTAGLTVPAHAATGSCADWPLALGEPNWLPPVLADKPLQLEIAVRELDYQAECAGLTAVVEKTDGTLRTTIALDKRGVTPPFEPPSYSRYNTITIPVANGAGHWRVVSLSQGGKTKVLNEEVFEVYRKAVVTLDQPVRTSGNAKTEVTGVVRQYDTRGVLVPVAGKTVEIIRDGGARVGTAKTDATGRYRLSVLFAQNTEIWTQYRDISAANDLLAAGNAPSVWVHKLLAMSYLNFAATTKVGALWSVTGTAFPGPLHTALEIYNGKAWVAAGSAGDTAANGAYARYWKPTRAGSFRLRVVVTGAGLDNSPWNREAVVTVK